MPDLSRLEALIARLAGIDFSQSSEQDTREIAVNTVIGELGWDTLDRNEVAREYSVRGGRVDYCLRSQTRNLVLIEVKRAGTDLAEHQEQLLRYAFDEGTSLAALTDGLVWWLYLPMEKVGWEQRRFARVNFREQQSADAAATLYRFLNRSGVVSGEAQEEAKREFESQERERRVRAALQDAWERVLGDPDSRLCEELADAVEDISGHRPDRDTISGFLQGMLGNAGRGRETSPVRAVQSEAAKLPSETRSYGTAQSPKLEGIVAAIKKKVDGRRDWEALGRAIHAYDMASGAFDDLGAYTLDESVWVAMSSFERYLVYTGHCRSGWSNGGGRSIAGLKIPTSNGRGYDKKRRRLAERLNAYGLECSTTVRRGGETVRFHG